jgi:hypothetical protein
MWVAQHGLIAAGVNESVAVGLVSACWAAAASCVRWLGRPQRAVEPPTRPHTLRGRNAEPRARNAGSELVLLPRTFICGG